MNSRRGFTILELIITVTIIAVLAGIIIVAINPSRQFATSRNTQRQSDLEKILGSLNQYAIEGNGSFPAGVSSTLQMLGTATTTCNVACTGASSTASSCLNLSASLTPTLIQSIPFDPTAGSAAKTYYAVQKINTGNIRLRACSPELNKTIEIIQ